jgi:hypothetical protein
VLDLVVVRIGMAIEQLRRHENESGVQKSHWNAPCSMKASWIGSRVKLFVRGARLAFTAVNRAMRIAHSFGRGRIVSEQWNTMPDLQTVSCGLIFNASDA